MLTVKDEYLYIVSGSLLVVISYIIWRFYRVDPIDSGLILNEQAINLTSQYSDEVRNALSMSDFVKDLRSDARRTELYRVGGNTIKVNGSTQDMTMHLSEEKLRDIEETQVLKRWKSPSIIEAL